ncbi:hypothetical protein GPECTOR_19g319 [Gonium pectorale]|uniref:Uncharacterized protein n=1 Tax=Gonium pectorale TaxID=33097 RepID=A0A150GJ82_GONPE|nr:hypothetical protein GPECTOR_19g319 [Gonium pectorale]|eukprot:KXZ49868.1 hypothetical protein GPECTOR_19g319 [Gonium pectorale]
MDTINPRAHYGSQQAGGIAASTAPPPSSHGPYGTGAGAGVKGGVQRPPLRSLQWLWSSIVWYWSTLTWFVTLPWRVLSFLTPGFLQPYMRWTEETANWWTSPVTRLASDATYGTIAFFDHQLSWLRGTVASTHSSNVHHFWVAYEAYLRLIQHKAHLIETHGFDGLRLAFVSRTV